MKIADKLDLGFIHKLDLGELRRCVDKLIEVHGEDSTLDLAIGRSKPDGEGDTHAVAKLTLLFRREEMDAERAKRMKDIGIEF